MDDSTTQAERDRQVAFLKQVDQIVGLLSHGREAVNHMAYFAVDGPSALSCLSLGVEALAKLTLSLATAEETGEHLSKRDLKKLGHGIHAADVAAREAIERRTSMSTAPGYLGTLKSVLDKNRWVPPLISALERWADQGRYHFADMLAGAPQPGAEPSSIWWEELEERISLHERDIDLLGKQLRGHNNALVTGAFDEWFAYYKAAWQTGAIGRSAVHGAAQLGDLFNPYDRRRWPIPPGHGAR